MNHVALDRPRSDDRDLDHQVVEFFGLEPRQHAHLRPALDLEHSDAIGPAQHLVDRRIFGRDRSQGQLLAGMPVEQLECLSNAGQHAERQDVDLENAERVEIVLVPLDHGTVRHRRIGDRHHLIEPALGQDEAADMLREVAGEAGQLGGELQGQAQARLARIEAALARRGSVDAAIAPAPDRRGQRAGHVLRQAQRLADVANRAA